MAFLSGWEEGIGNCFAKLMCSSWPVSPCLWSSANLNEEQLPFFPRKKGKEVVRSVEVREVSSEVSALLFWRCERTHLRFQLCFLEV